uniref:Complement component 1 Q subcomponent-binding protein, mitochondrial n=1 Tax=Timema monikensis TaxID=170555 RepID=A0A7R9E8X3_9NEOP|nr:unnamed protein product [Timema monikensis]
MSRVLMLGVVEQPGSCRHILQGYFMLAMDPSRVRTPGFNNPMPAGAMVLAEPFPPVRHFLTTAEKFLTNHFICHFSDRNQVQRGAENQAQYSMATGSFVESGSFINDVMDLNLDICHGSCAVTVHNDDQDTIDQVTVECVSAFAWGEKINLSTPERESNADNPGISSLCITGGHDALWGVPVVLSIHDSGLKRVTLPIKQKLNAERHGQRAPQRGLKAGIQQSVVAGSRGRQEVSSVVSWDPTVCSSRITCASGGAGIQPSVVAGSHGRQEVVSVVSWDPTICSSRITWASGGGECCRTKPVLLGLQRRQPVAQQDGGNGEKELVEFLAEEIVNEQKAHKSKNIPSEVDGFKVLKIEINFNINHTVDADADTEAEVNPNMDKPEFGELKSKPNFEVDIKRGSQTLSFTYDIFGIDEVTLFKNEWNDKCYAVAGDVLDGYLYDLLMNLLEEKGISNEFVDKLCELSTAYEHSSYIKFLEGLQKGAQKRYHDYLEVKKQERSEEDKKKAERGN